MNVLFYVPFKSKDNEKIYGLADTVSLSAETKIFENIDDLSRRLCQPADGPSIAVLLAGDKDELADIVSARHLFSEIPVILILSEREESATAMGYRLGPRFLTYADSNLTEVVAVLAKMLENYNKKGVLEEWDNIWNA